MIFANVKTITTQKGNVVKIEDSKGVLWSKIIEPQLKGNLVPTSIDTDGSIYNGVGYADGYRMNSSGSQVAYSGTAITGWMLCEGISDADTIYVKGVTIQNATYCGITFYDENFNILQTSRLLPDSVPSVSDYDVNQAVVHSSGSNCVVNGDITTITINFNEPVTATYPIKYFRIFGYGSGADMDIRINEEITN